MRVLRKSAGQSGAHVFQPKLPVVRGASDRAPSGHGQPPAARGDQGPAGQGFDRLGEVRAQPRADAGAVQGTASPVAHWASYRVPQIRPAEPGETPLSAEEARYIDGPPLSVVEIRAALFGRSGERLDTPKFTPEELERLPDLWPVQRSHKAQHEWAGKLRTITPATPFDGLGREIRR